jgi:hypothetical protein
MGSGTRHNFITRLLGAIDTSTDPWTPPTGPSCPAPVVLGTDDSGIDLAHDSTLRGDDQAYVMPYSGAAWVRQANNAVNPTLDLRAGVRPGAIKRDATDPVAPGQAVTPVRWLGSSWRLNDATVIGGRSLSVTSDARFDTALVAAPGSFSASDVGLTLQGPLVTDGTIILAVSTDGTAATISPGTTQAGNATVVVGSAVVRISA